MSIDNNPVLQGDSPLNTELPSLPLKEVTDTTSHDEVRQLDMQMMHCNFVGMAQAWKLVGTSDEIIRVALATSKLIKERRDLLQIPYGTSNSSEQKRTFVCPID